MTPTDTAPTVEVRSDKPPTLEEAQAFVGGPVEALDVGYRTLLFNENGRLLGMPFNRALFDHFRTRAGHLAFQVFRANLVGNVLILTGDAKEGWS
tara:strand:- start:273 stop:557 length:285 start_codon:yes stop_codon:yes gene_type:complete